MGLNTAWARGFSAINTALHDSFGVSPEFVAEFPSLSSLLLSFLWNGMDVHVWWLTIGCRKVLQIQDGVQCYCPPCFLSICLWAPLPSCCKDFSSQRFSWEVFKLLFWELVNTQHSANVSLCEHVVKMQYICSQRLATGSKTKTVHNGEGKFRNYMPDLLLLLLVSSPMFNAEKRKEISLS